MKDNERGQITVDEAKKRREIISEQGKEVEVPTHFSRERKKALEQTGEDATQGW
jgi:hypothetical protein